MDDTTIQGLLSLLRSGLLAGSTWAVQAGWVSGDNATAIVGGLVAIATAVWGYYQKHAAEVKTQSRVTTAAITGVTTK